MAEKSAVFMQNSAHASDNERFSARVHVDASPSELCFAIMARVFHSIAPVLSSFVKSSMKNAYGTAGWLDMAKSCLGAKMRSFCREKEVWDLFTSCEIMLENMDRVFLTHSQDLDVLQCRGGFLEQVTHEVDTVSQSRNWLFHSEGLSPSEAVRCLMTLRRMLKRFSLEEHIKEAGKCALQDHLQVRRKN